MKKIEKIKALARRTGLATFLGTTLAMSTGLEYKVEESLSGSWPLVTNTLDTTERKNDGIPTETFFRHGAAFNGSNYIEIPSLPGYSKAGNPGLTVSFYMKLDSTNFEHTENGYVNYLGKGEPGKHEWTFRIYNEKSERPSRISFYLFNPEGGLGSGSYVQEPIKTGEWMYLTGVADDRYTYLYKNGELKDKDNYISGQVHIEPQAADAPVRIGTRDFRSFIDHAKIAKLRIYEKPLTEEEVKKLYDSEIPPMEPVPQIPGNTIDKPDEFRVLRRKIIP